MAFPTTPNDGDVYIKDGVRFVYASATNTWTVQADPDKIAGNIKDTINIDGVVGTYDHEASNPIAVATVLSGKVGFVNGAKITGTMTNKVGSATVLTPSTSDQAFPAGYYGGATGDGKVLGDADLVAGNIKSGVNIFGVAGTHEGPPSLENYTYVSDGTFRIYYKKFGKLYVIMGFFEPNIYGPIIRGGNSAGSEDTGTINRICSLLGITKSSVIILSELGDVSSYALNGARYYSGGVWNSENGSVYPLLAILST